MPGPEFMASTETKLEGKKSAEKMFLTQRKNWKKNISFAQTSTKQYLVALYLAKEKMLGKGRKSNFSWNWSYTVFKYVEITELYSHL